MVKTVKIESLPELLIEQPNLLHIQESYLRQIAHAKPFTAKKKRKSDVAGTGAKKFRRIYAILNGTSNYILTEMTQKKQKFQEVLKRAQELGYAEADPTLDVEGIDTAHKLSIPTITVERLGAVHGS